MKFPLPLIHSQATASADNRLQYFSLFFSFWNFFADICRRHTAVGPHSPRQAKKTYLHRLDDDDDDDDDDDNDDEGAFRKNHFT